MRNIGIMAASVAVIGLTACTQPEGGTTAAPVTAALAGPQPSETMAQTFRGCTWGEVTGGGLSVWSYDCPAASGDFRMAYDANLPGFVMTGNSDGEAWRNAAIVIFKKAAEAPIDSILAEVRAKSPGPHSATCVLSTIPSPEGDVAGFEPTGSVKTQWDAFASGAEGAEPMDAPCGDMGPQMSGDRGFRVLADDPTTVVFIEYGSEIQPFDPATVRKAG
ncbi:hypothetical protein [Brevundimonas sp. NIBR11]|uniref:hypothetical protein n=1 Tax=Brevundimonas sp. NIBR11 TaxID=3015999 RepID=UPI0022F057E9|nr:hypothetical protein [Brevundimonas sp. NIBR11]WGM30446.1 hypothetical protein KKHFBJBL_00670 [Brevundimonas sp. NIBR11]